MVKIATFLSAAAVFAVSLAQNDANGQGQNQGKRQNNNNGNGQGNAARNAANNNAQASAVQQQGADGTSLNANAIQTGSFSDGSASLGADAGQALSLTDKANFINFCSGKTLTNGLQITTGSCNGIVMGDIPAKSQMVSTVILNPQDGQTIQAGQDFNITVQVANLAAGSFTNADATYYAAPQTLKGGIIVGHTHVTVQDLGASLNPKQPLDATQFAFFKGINDAGNGQGTLQAVVTGGLPAGNFRVCTLTSASNHQPVVMPVAQRGAQDDCTRFTVKGAGGAANEAANNGAKGQAAAQSAQDAVNAGPGALTTTAAAAAAANTAAAAAAGNSANNAAQAGNNNNANNNAAKNSSANAQGQQQQQKQQGKQQVQQLQGQQQQKQQQGQQPKQQQQQRQNQRLARLARRHFVS